MIYFDNNATTKMDPEVIKTVLSAMEDTPTNPSAITGPGRKAKLKLLNARVAIAKYFDIDQDEITFTSSATESINIIIKSFHKKNPGSIITTRIEHPCLLRTIEQLENQQTKVIYLPTPNGEISMNDLSNSINSATSFIALSSANSETGCKHPISKIAEIANLYNIPLIIDGVASLGKEDPINFIPYATALTFSAHKIHGPPGISVAICKKPYKLNPLIFGGNQEDSIRPGTENLPAILGFAKCIEILEKKQNLMIKHMQDLRDSFEKLLLQTIPNAKINGNNIRICNVSNIYFNGCDGESLLINLDQKGVIASLGSACSSGALSASHVLLNMGFPKERALSSLRFSFSKFNTHNEINQAVQYIQQALEFQK